MRPAIYAIAMVAAFLPNLSAQDTRVRMDSAQIEGPDSADDGARWLADLRHWRMERLIRIGFDDAQYRRPELAWTGRAFVQPQMMAEERYFYDPVARRYTVDRYLDDLEKRYGGIDAVLIWPTYPNIGIDDRNQFDLFHDLPGGMAGIRQMIADFHRRGVRVLFPVMPWDQGTRDSGEPMWETLARQLAEVGADGVNGDTLEAVPRAMRVASDATGHPLALEPEFLRIDEALGWNNMSWGSLASPFVPAISRHKWLEPRHLMNICRRWDRDKRDSLQHAWFNGTGYESWENVWGIWNQISGRDAEALRRIAKLERHFADLLVAAGWEPHTPTLRYGVFASRFPSAERTLYTVVNRNEFTVAGEQLEIPHTAGARYYDVWHGVELKPVIRGGGAVVSFEMEGNGYGGVLMTREADGGLQPFLAGMRELARVKLAALDSGHRVLAQQITRIAPTRRAAATPEGMVRIPGARAWLFRVSGIEIEGSNQSGVDVQYPWEDAARRHHRRTMRIEPFYLERTPVTNAAFKKFVDATKYHPADDHNFLRHWVGGSYPPGAGNQPVRWVSLEDARAYAEWTGKRLPHEWEWQYAAQGDDGRLYPWGNQWEEDAVPVPDTGRTMRAPDEVGRHSKGASVFGVEDMTGLVWQWTEEFTDEHTRAAILRGGSYYRPQGSRWYFPQAYQLNQHGKLLMMAPGKDRSGAVGFRCAMDAE
ncbi:MAG: SUMF1/EgtB/PvdO family nonheme iron enzyme [Bryobacterales bacterium]|nr:SUMF1/EgtB/PvdO family nonheme iron enzyme [Bryobacterales bacterium]